MTKADGGSNVGPRTGPSKFWPGLGYKFLFTIRLKSHPLAWFDVFGKPGHGAAGTWGGYDNYPDWPDRHPSGAQADLLATIHGEYAQ
jgi:hypothetical protein